jgi:uncharacterized protein YjbJ (UPF0337 family)
VIDRGERARSIGKDGVRCFRNITAGRTLSTQRHLEDTMDWNRVEGNWKQTKGKIKEKWGQLTEDDLTQIDGKRDQLEGMIQERYGIAKDRARKDVEDWLSTMH